MANTATLAGINSTIISDSNGHSLLVLDDSGHALYSLQDVMEGLTLIDIDDMLNRLPPESVAKVSGKWFIHVDWIDYMLHYARNPKAYKFNEWLLKEVKPMVKEFLMTNAAAKTDATKTDAAKMIPAAAQTDTVKMTAEASKTNTAKMTSVAELIKFLGTNNATYYRMLKANHADTADFRGKDGAFTDDGLKRLKAMLESRKAAAANHLYQTPATQPIMAEITQADSLLEFVNKAFGKVRGAMVNDEPWLLGKDIAEILQYKNPQEAIRMHVDDEDKGVCEFLTPGGMQKTPFINETGLYSLIFSSKLPAAKQFKRWVTHDVLPAIRKTGGYIVGEEKLSDDDLVARALLVVTNKLKLREQEISDLNKRIEADAPKVAFADAVEDKGGNLTLGDFAKLLYNDDTPTGRTRFIRWLRANGYFIQSAPLPYQQYIDLGWFLVRLKEIPNGDIVSVALVTPKGQMALTNAFKQSRRIAG